MRFLMINHQNFQNAPHRSAILTDLDEDKSTKFRGCLERERDLRYETDQNVKNIELSRAGAQFLKT